MPMYIGLAITVLILKKRIAATTLLFIKGHLCHPHPNELKPDNRRFSMAKITVLRHFPSRAEGGPEGADRGKAHLNDVRFNSN